MFKFQFPSEYSPHDAMHLPRRFFHCSKQFLKSLILMPFMLLLLFVSPFPHQQNVSLWGLSSSGEIKQTIKVTLGKIGWMGGNGCQLFLVKNCWTQCSLGRCTCISPIMEWANALKESSKKLTEAECSLSHQRQLVHWYRWVPRTLN